MKSIVRIILYCIMGAYLIIGAAKLTEGLIPSTASPVEILSSAAAEVMESSERSTEGYIVREVSGKIAIEDKSSGKIIRTTDTRTSSLPEKDRERLEQGIAVKNNSELRHVLEDYCS